MVITRDIFVVVGMKFCPRLRAAGGGTDATRRLHKDVASISKHLGSQSGAARRVLGDFFGSSFFMVGTLLFRRMVGFGFQTCRSDKFG